MHPGTKWADACSWAIKGESSIVVDVISSYSIVTCAQTMAWMQLLAGTYRQLDAICLVFEWWTTNQCSELYWFGSNRHCAIAFPTTAQVHAYCTMLLDDTQSLVGLLDWETRLISCRTCSSTDGWPMLSEIGTKSIRKQPLRVMKTWKNGWHHQHDYALAWPAAEAACPFNIEQIWSCMQESQKRRPELVYNLCHLRAC